MVLAALLCCAPAPAPAVRIPIGHAALDVDYIDIDHKIGGAFVPGVRNGANTCYTDALRQDPNQKGEIAFVLRPPKGEGRLLAGLETRGSLGAALVACVDGVFGGFHGNQKPFDRIEGTLRFEPRWISAPAPPTPEAARAALGRIYSHPRVVRVDKVVLRSVSDYSDPTSSRVFRRYFYDLELVFRANGYEAVCHHGAAYKVFGRRPHISPFSGHSCENHRRKAGDRVTDTATVIFGLTYYPSVATAWKLQDGSE